MQKRNLHLVTFSTSVVTVFLLLIGCSLVFQFFGVPATQISNISPSVAVNLKTSSTTTNTPSLTLTTSSTPTSASSPTLIELLLASLTASPTLDPAVCVPDDNDPEYGLVKWVIDGDTIQVDFGDQLRIVRYIGINAPNVVPDVEFMGPPALRHNEALVLNKAVRLFSDVYPTNEDNQLIRYVFVGDIFVNYEMVRKGLAQPAVTPPNVACKDIFNQARIMAKQDEIGLWMKTPTITGTFTPTPTPTGTWYSPTPTATNTATKTPFGTLPTPTPSYTLTPTPTGTWYTATPSPTLTLTPTPTGTWYTATPTSTLTETPTPTGTWYTPTPSPTLTSTPTPTGTWYSPTPTPKPTKTPTPTGTWYTPTPTDTNTPTLSGASN